METSTPAIKNPVENANRRRGNRHQLNIPATLAIKGEPEINVTVTALSVGGFGIQSKTALRINAIYQLHSFDTLIPQGMKIRIVSQRQTSEFVFQIGAEGQ